MLWFMSARKQVLLFLFLCIPLVAQTPTSVQATTFTATGVGNSIDQRGSGIGYHQIIWRTTGTVTTCTVNVESSSDGITWNTADVIADQTCTSNNTASNLATTANYDNFVRVRLKTLTGGGTVYVTYIGYVNKASSASGGVVLAPAGTVGAPGLAVGGFTNSGIYFGNNFTWSYAGAQSYTWRQNSLTGNSNFIYAWANGSTPDTQVPDTGISRSAADNIAFGNGTQGDTSATIQAAKYNPSGTCTSSGGTCGASSYGFVTIAAAATTRTVATTSVTANSLIEVYEDSSLGALLGVTCNTTLGRTYAITTRTAATSFVVTSSAAPTTNPACLAYEIKN